mgnify:CR=1 FL=1
MYKITDRKYTQGTDLDGRAISVCALYCDDVTDLPNMEQIAKDAIGFGSYAWLANQSNFATLMSNGEWRVDSE